ncbi:AraC family transcriptional regulator [Cohaesibacter celericrescens]|nr:AraC family transcriptional regulator [Cohaesibacter celericrescens]
MTGKQAPSKLTTAKDYETRLLRVLKHIDENLDGPLKLEELASIANFSPFHFHRLFKGMTGETLGGYIRRRRLLMAANQLRTSKASITELALDAAFENSESFSRAFKILFGVSPSQYRRNGQVLITPQGLSSLATGYQNSEAIALLHYLQHEARRMSFDVKIKQMPTIKLAYIRHTGSYFKVGPTFEQAIKAVHQQGLWSAESMVLGLSYDNPSKTEEHLLRCDAGVSVSPDATVCDPLALRDIQAGDYATVMLKGPYDQIAPTYDWFYGQWLPQSGRETANHPPVEIFHSDARNTPPQDLLTEIRIPLV